MSTCVSFVTLSISIQKGHYISHESMVCVGCIGVVSVTQKQNIPPTPLAIWMILYYCCSNKTTSNKDEWYFGWWCGIVRASSILYAKKVSCHYFSSPYLPPWRRIPPAGFMGFFLCVVGVLWCCVVYYNGGTFLRTYKAPQYYTQRQGNDAGKMILSTG